MPDRRKLAVVPARNEEGAIGRVGVDSRCPDPQRGGADALDLGAEIQQQSRHDLNVADARDIGEDALLFGQEAGRQQRQRSVLVSLNGDPAFESVAAFNQ